MKNHHAIGRFGLFSAIILSFIFLAAGVTFAQTSEFTHQGKFPETGGTASGNYQMEFKLFDAATGGTQVGTTISIASVPVTKSVFSVNLDFGAAAFPGADRFLEIATRKTSSEPFAILGPRQKITSAPYSIKSKFAETATAAITADSAVRATTAVNALQLGGLGANRYVRFDDNDNVGIGTTSTGSKLAVGGTIESKSGGFKFPDATTQTTAGITSVNTNATLTGSGSVASPLGVASPLMVRDLDHPTRQSFALSAEDVDEFLTVPPGKAAVIEFASVRLVKPGTTLDLADVALRIYGGGDSFGQWFYLAPSSTRLLSGSPTEILAHYTYVVRLYLRSDQKLQLRCGNAFITECKGTVAGYYVDAP